VGDAATVCEVSFAAAYATDGAKLRQDAANMKKKREEKRTMRTLLWVKGGEKEGP